jgi:hypothetical protein
MLYYHYCSNYAFCSIIEQRRVRLSLLSLSNDAKEGHHILDVAARLLPADFEQKEEALTQLRQILSLISAIGFCVSQDGDLLSQWSGYADNARGVAIGLDREALEKAADEETSEDFKVRFAPVAYDDDFLAEVMSPDLNPIIERYNSGRMRPPSYSTILMAPTDEEIEAAQRRYESAFKELANRLLRIANYAYMVNLRSLGEKKNGGYFPS